MKRSVAVLLALTVAVAGRLSAQPDATRIGSAHYAPLEFLAGSCWMGIFPGGAITDTHCYEWMYDRRYLRDRHVVSSKPTYEGETIYAWDPASRQVVFRYVSNQGLFLNGTVEQRGDSISFPSHYPDDQGHMTEIRAVWVRQGKDAYHALQYQREGDAWKLVMDVVYRRKA